MFECLLKDFFFVTAIKPARFANDLGLIKRRDGF